MDYTELAKAFGAIFAIMNPFINLPIFLALTTGFTVAEQRVLAAKITLYSAIMCTIVLVAGQAIISFFGISVDEFRIAGGIVLAHIAWSMLNGESIPSHQGSPADHAHQEELSSLAFYPITFPMVVGPGTIATLIIYSSHAGSTEALLSIGGIVAVILAMMFVVLNFASQIGKVLSETMRVITMRLMGMILLAIAVDMIAHGVIKIFPGLA